MLAATGVIISLIIMEGILSIDNAAVLATMVRHLPKEQQERALRYGILGAYVFRGLALIFAGILIKIAFLKLLGGLYLAWLAFSHFTKKENTEETVHVVARGFWMTVLWVEIMDMAFSIDNVFAAVAMSPNIWVVITGVFIGILAMRFVAGKFIVLMDKYPQLETSAYIVIGMLGAKLTFAVLFKYLGFHGAEEFMEGHTASGITSGATVLLFAFPILKAYLANRKVNV